MTRKKRWHQMTQLIVFPRLSVHFFTVSAALRMADDFSESARQPG
jgi:hypothetical protein